MSSILIDLPASIEKVGGRTYEFGLMLFHNLLFGTPLITLDFLSQVYFLCTIFRFMCVRIQFRVDT